MWKHYHYKFRYQNIFVSFLLQTCHSSCVAVYTAFSGWFQAPWTLPIMLRWCWRLIVVSSYKVYGCLSCFRYMYWADWGSVLKFERARVEDPDRNNLMNSSAKASSGDTFLPMVSQGKEPKIERARLDGSERTVLVNSSLRWPSSLVLDSSTDTLYWCDRRLHRIDSLNLTSLQTRSVVGNVTDCKGVAVLGDYIYWVDLCVPFCCFLL